MRKVKVAIIGYGGVARMHNNAYARLVDEGVPVELVAVCDKDVARLTMQLKFNLGNDVKPLPSGVRFYSDMDELIAKEDFDMADICLPSFMHKDATIKFLRAGKHVLCEKPMAISSADCKEMLAAKEESGKRFMIAQSIRFSDPYLYLKEYSRTGRFGKLRELVMSRVTNYPSWGEASIFNDVSKCGGATLDTHLHDIDFAQYMVGKPDCISAVEHINIPYCQTVSTQLHYKDLSVIADCAWDVAIPAFAAKYHARFDKGAIVYENNKLTVYPYTEAPFTPELDERDSFAEEIRYMVNLILDENEKNTRCSPYATFDSVRIIEAIRKSASLGGELIKFEA